MDFWADNADLYLTVGQPFDLWYGRVVGSGVLTTWLGAQINRTCRDVDLWCDDCVHERRP